MAQLNEYDVVEVVNLIEPKRPVLGTEPVLRQPRIGDRGTIVHMPVAASGTTIYIVESVDGEGNTVWLADFAPEEIRLYRK